LRTYRPPHGRGQSVHLAGLPDLIIATINLSAPAHWCCNDLNIHLGPELVGFAAKVVSARPGPGRSVIACRSIFG
jgi:hypothetical protein